MKQHQTMANILNVLDGAGIEVPYDLHLERPKIYKVEVGVACEQGENVVTITKDQLHDHIVDLARAFKRLWGE